MVNSEYKLTIGQLVYNYRKEHKISQRAFGKLCGFSDTYLSMLEKGVNSTTGKPINPTIDALKKIASAMGLTFDQLLGKLNGEVVLESGSNNAELEKLFAVFSPLTEEQKKLIIHLAEEMSAKNHPKKGDSND